MADKELKADVDYHLPKEATSRICGNCSMFVEPDKCTAVEGYIDPLAVCKLFEPHT